MKLLQTKDYLLLIDEVSGFKRGDWNYEIDNNIPIYQFGYDIDEYPGNKIIAYHPLTKEAEELDLPLLPPFEEVDINKIADKWFLINNYNKEDLIHSHTIPNCITNKNLFIAGYKAAQQYNKQFSIEDVKKAFEEGGKHRYICEANGKDKKCYCRNDNECNFASYITSEEYAQSLSTQQLPKEFIVEEKSIEDIQKELNIYGHDEGLTESEYNEYLKTNSIYKTITNSEGKEILVGTYKY